MSSHVQLLRNDAVATIRLNRPEAMNSLTRTIRKELLEALTEVGQDESVRAVVLTGSGRAFCVGHDLKEHIANISGDLTPEEIWRLVPDEYNPMAQAVADLDKPVIAAVNGVAAGAGAALSFLADLRILATSAGYNLAFSGIALSCDTGSSWSLPRLVGPTKAMELLLTPATISSTQALQAGLATEVVPDVEFEERVADVAARLAAGPTLAYASIRKSVAYATTHTLAESLSFEAEMMARTGQSRDHRAAVEAFLAKQPPRFEGN